MIDALQLWATQTANDAAHRICQLVERAEQDIRLGLCSKLVHVASKVVALREGAGVEDTTGEITDVDASKGASGAGVAVNVLVQEQTCGMYMTYPPISRNFGWSAAALRRSARK